MWEESLKLPEWRMAALALAFAAGILSANYLPPLGCFLVCTLFILAGFACFRDNRRTAIVIISSVFLLGAARFLLHAQIPTGDISRIPARITAFEGTIAEDPDTRPKSTRVIVKTDRAQFNGAWKEVSGLVMVTVKLPDDMTRLSYGDRLHITARPYPPFAPTNPGQFSWRDYLARQGIHTCASVKHPEQMRVIKNQGGNTMVAAALIAKDAVSSSIQSIHPKREASVIIGMVLGTYSYLPKETFDNFSRTGTLHLLAASGYNCFILLFLTLPVLKMIRMPSKGRSFAVVLILVVYVLMVGTKPSLVRAAIMSGLWLLATPLGRTPNINNLFFTAGLVTLAFRPSDLFDVGFQLSFAAVWALIKSAELIQTTLVMMGLHRTNTKVAPSSKQNNRLNAIIAASAKWSRRELTSAAVATITVTLYTAPIVAYYFNNVSLVSLPANIALALCVPVVFAVGLVSVVAANVPLLGDAVGFIGTKVTQSILGIVNYLGGAQYSAVTVATPSPLAIVGYYILLHCGLSFLRAKNDER